MEQSTQSGFAGRGLAMPSVAAMPRRILDWLAVCALAEQRRWLLWSPVTLGVGIGIYFALPVEPAGWIAPVLLGLLLVAALLLGRYRPLWAQALVILLVLPVLGLLVAQVRTDRVRAPVLAAEIGPIDVIGTVIAQEPLEKGGRVLMEDLTIPGMVAAQTPARVRIRLRADDILPRPGQRVRVWAVIGPPGDPVEPGAFDFRRHLYFQGIGGVGYARGRVQVRGMAPDPPFTTRLETLRQAIAGKVDERLDGAVSGMTAALLNGQPSAIPEEDLEAMRQSGLQHLLSISGLHVGLVAGLVLLAVRALLALWPALALRYPIKKFAAIIALAAAFFYMLMVGAPVPTQRSVLMTGVMLLAILADRNPFSIRVIAVAALAVMLTQPESILGPSFQMSFAAVAALILVYEAMTPFLARHPQGEGRLGRALRGAGGLAFTSLIASLATTPFGLYHFQQMANYGVLANMIAVPVTSFWVMPWGLLVYLLMPLGLEGPAIIAMGWGVEVILWTAHWVTGMPGAAIQVPALPLWGMAAFTLGALWVGLWQGRWRWLGGIGIGAALLSLPLASMPDIRVSGEGAVAAIRTADGGLLVSTRRASRFDSDAWAQRDGLAEIPKRWPPIGSPVDGLRCDGETCLYEKNGQRVGLLLGATAFCPAGVGALLALRGAPECPAPIIIGPAERAAHGAHALHLSATGIRVETVRPQPDARPWH